VSGGHTSLYEMEREGAYVLLGKTRDDAAGEAFDKGARLLGLGYPGGPAIQRAAEGGDPTAFEFPVAMSERGLDFSFSGLKTALVYRVRELGPEQTETGRADLAASYQRAITEQLVAKLGRAARGGDWPAIALGGGVAANAELRERTRALCDELGVPLKLVPIALCTDNAAMIGSAARYTQSIPYPDYLGFDAFASAREAQAA
jgi:N6-L-threonylcarbamoyladenine synthase